MIRLLLFYGFLVFSLIGCESVGLLTSIRNYYEVAPQVKLGEDKEKALGLLLPAQEKLYGWEKKAPESYKEGGNLVEIYYFRTGWQTDGLTTDDEFVPYVFTNGVLTSIGWTALGGPKTVGQVIQPAPVTNIEVNQEKN
ncbi:MAG: DUF3192 domain-containing protein [Candidatus Omnitrophica bacterium]|nr:DUF3192 domain-containing protein [Candidatus Omnitrophota bacterium]